MKHNFKSIEGAVRRVRELEKINKRQNALLDSWRADKDRLDWLNQQFEVHLNDDYEGNGWSLQIVTGNINDRQYLSLAENVEDVRTAIDTAIKVKPSK